MGAVERPGLGHARHEPVELRRPDVGQRGQGPVGGEAREGARLGMQDRVRRVVPVDPQAQRGRDVVGVLRQDGVARGLLERVQGRLEGRLLLGAADGVQQADLLATAAAVTAVTAVTAVRGLVVAAAGGQDEGTGRGDRHDAPTASHVSHVMLLSVQACWLSGLA